MKIRIFTNERLIEFEVSNRKELNNETIPSAYTMIENGEAYAAEIVYKNGWKEIL